MRALAITFLSILVAGVFFLGCRKEEIPGGHSRLSIRMHDMPVDFDEVNIEIVKVTAHTNTSGWIDLPTNAGIYNLLDFQDGIDTLLVPQCFIPEGELSQVRFILGAQNNVVINGVSFPLSLSSQDESGLKINVHQELQDSEDYMILVDFNAEQSVMETGNGTWKLKPVLSAIIVQ